MWFLPLLGGNDSPDVTFQLAHCILTLEPGNVTITQGGDTPVTLNLDPATLTLLPGDLTITQGPGSDSGGGGTVYAPVTVRAEVTVRAVATV